MTEPKQIIHKDLKYEDWIRDKPCLICQRPPRSEAHHCWHTGRKNGGNSYLAVPLCTYHHTFGSDAYHVVEAKRFQEIHNKDLKDEIINLLSEYIESLKNDKKGAFRCF